MSDADDPTPAADPAVYDRLAALLAERGPGPAVDALCDELRRSGDYTSMFYAELIGARLRMGLSPVPTAPSSEIPEAHADDYENAVRDAARRAGSLYLEAGNIPRAWGFFRMIGEPGPVRAAIDAYDPPADADVQPVIDVAFYQGAHPKRGFDIFLDRLGICSAITLTGGYDFPHSADVRAHCIGRLVQALHDQVRERIVNEATARGESVPAGASLAELCEGRDWLSAEDCYLVDTSHLSSVVQMSVHLSAGDAARLARGLCAYGRRLAPAFQPNGETPFDDLYADADLYLAAVTGERVDEAAAHFRAKAEAGLTEGITYPAEMLVAMLERAGRPAEALTEARRFLADGPERPGSCSSVYELARKANDYRALSDAARERGDPVHFLAGLIAARLG